jgi:hypothetical protein
VSSSRNISFQEPQPNNNKECRRTKAAARGDPLSHGCTSVRSWSLLDGSALPASLGPYAGGFSRRNDISERHPRMMRCPLHLSSLFVSKTSYSSVAEESGSLLAAMTDPLRICQQVTIKHFCLVLLLVGIASGQHCRKIDIDKSSGFCTVPDHSLTPGKMQASLACVSKH